MIRFLLLEIHKEPIHELLLLLFCCTIRHISVVEPFFLRLNHYSIMFVPNHFEVNNLLLAVNVEIFLDSFDIGNISIFLQGWWVAKEYLCI